MSDESPIPEGTSYDDFVAHLPDHTYIYRPTRAEWTKDGVNAALPWQDMLDANGQPVVDSKGRPKKIPPNTIIDREVFVHAKSWMPGEGEIARDCAIVAGGRIAHGGCHTYNLYQGPKLNGAKGDPSRWVKHIAAMYPEHGAHIIHWFAYKVQHPGKKINHALVLGGHPGIGKDTIIEPVRQAIGAWNFGEANPNQILDSRFNAYRKSVLLRIAEAKDLGEFNRYNLYEAMKTLIAAPPDTLEVNGKYAKTFFIPNVMGVIITTNHRTGALYFPPNDRRHYVCWSDAEKEKFSDQYWSDIWGWYEKENGFAVVAHYLRTLDLAAFDPKAPPALTPAFWAMVHAEASGETSELHDVLDMLNRPNAVTTAMVYAKAHEKGLSDFGQWIMDRRNSRRIPHTFEQCGYIAFRNVHADDGLWKIAGRRCTVYAPYDVEGNKVASAIAALQNDNVHDFNKARPQKGATPPLSPDNNDPETPF